MANIKNVLAPDFGGATEVTVVEILVKPGDHVTVDTTIVILESDKATMEIPSSEPGTVQEIKVQVGDKIATGDTLLTVSDTATSAKKTATEKIVAAPEKKAPPTSPTAAVVPSSVEKKEKPTAVAPASKEHAEEVHAGPGVRRLARELGVDLVAIAGSGPKQRILREDVHAYVKARLQQLPSGQASTTPAFSVPTVDFSQFGEIERQSLSRIKKLSGKNLQRNWMMIPHVTQFGSADITDMENFRQANKQEAEKQNIKLTPLVFIIKAVVAALKAFPSFNASLDASGEQLILKKYFHIGVAVDTPEGLVVPVIRDADKKNISELAKELMTVSERARKKQLLPGEMQGGCFSISSLGGIGGTAFTPIINYPEVAILGVSKASHQPIFQQGLWTPRLMLPLSLSYDHRVIDGAEGARFIVYLTEVLSDIRRLLL